MEGKPPACGPNTLLSPRLTLSFRVRPKRMSEKPKKSAAHSHETGPAGGAGRGVALLVGIVGPAYAQFFTFGGPAAAAAGGRSSAVVAAVVAAGSAATSSRRQQPPRRRRRVRITRTRRRRRKTTTRRSAMCWCSATPWPTGWPMVSRTP